MSAMVHKFAGEWLLNLT